MEWIQPRALERHYELKSDGTLFATLTWIKVFGSLAEASSCDGHFTLKRGGFLKPYVTIRDAALDNDIAMLRIGMFRHGTLEFTNGKRLTLVSKRFWGFEWELSDENGMRICSVRMRTSLTKRTGEVVIHEAVRRDRDLMTMLVICWYAMVLMSDEAAASGAATSATTTSVILAGSAH